MNDLQYLRATNLRTVYHLSDSLRRLYTGKDGGITTKDWELVMQRVGQWMSKLEAMNDEALKPGAGSTDAR